MAKPILLVPIAGRGQRFIDKSYVNPKPLIIAGNKHIIDYSFESIDPSEYDIVFVVRRDHVNSFSIDEVLKSKFGHDVKIVITEQLTAGSVSSCLLAREHLMKDVPLFIYTLDVTFSPKFSVKEVGDEDGLILTFKANSTAYSYVATENGYAVKTAEKQVISPNAAVGIYYFKSALEFLRQANIMVNKDLRTNGEFYICPLYNLMIEDGAKIKTKEVDKIQLMGTPEELDFFVRKTLPSFTAKPLAICADHSGFEAKKIFACLCYAYGIDTIDFGTYCAKDCDYNDFVRPATKHINDGLSDYGFGFCRTGQGINIAANKVKGIRSALVYDEYTAEHARRHNCANFFSIPSRINSEELPGILSKIRDASFDGGRHMSRVIKAESNANL